MNVKELMSVLTQLKDPEHRNLFFYYEDEKGNEQEFDVKTIGEFGISSDVTVGLKKITSPIARPMSKYELDNLPEDAKKHLKKVMKEVRKR